jgi:tetratricopeptide (TPR) repeat protein
VPRFAWFALAAAVLIAFDLARTHRRVPVDEPAPEAARAVPAPPDEPRRPARRRGRAVAATAALLLVVAAGQAFGQSEWAKGDRAFREQRFTAAESLYARRARQAGAKAPAELRVNLATARALAGRGPAAESLLADLARGGGPAGTTAAYNLGTLEARRGEYGGALQSLRRSLELDPDDPDARYNYELALRRREEQRRRQQGQPPPSPSPSTPSPRSHDQQAQAAPRPPPGTPPTPQSQPEAAPPPGGQAMDRRTAEQLLGSLAELERLEQQRLRRVRVVRERRGRDW